MGDTPGGGIVLTGDRPTGPLHIGHYVGSLSTRLAMQGSLGTEGGFDRLLFLIADMQALTDNAHNVMKVRENVLEVALDYLAVGIDPDKSTMFIQSTVPELAELTMYYLNFVTLARLRR
ncbi:MAG: tryptophan--tRNA ligase, partial [Oscillospiraceae bacterium]|nr:tryptophan--tRNA ligase [Oscillospiraceae bacterium]